ncbi:MAG TPA: DUF998 domain-containing protein [Candidatus Dormibacteraeota bacterium]|nr:DUF998 domain-containing protein [Candidatus Dormibacteraeota bacterium]
MAGLLGPPFFVVVFLVLGLIKPGYDALARTVSEGSIGELGWIQIANFLICGAAFVVFAFGLWQGFGDRWSGRVGSALVALAGIGLMGAGVFVGDPGFQATTFHGNMHMLASVVVFVSLLIGAFFFARRFWPDRQFALYSILSGLAIPAGFIAIAALGRWPGLVQRVMIALVWTWLTILALRLRRSTA